MTPPRRYRPDATLQQHGTTVVGGSPLRLFRLTERGAAEMVSVLDGEVTKPSKLIETLVDAGALHPEPSDPTFSDDDVTIVVPAIEPPRHLPIDDAIVIDDAATTPIPGAHRRLDRNRGPAAARNAGLELVDTELVAFVDTDVELPPGWLDDLLTHFSDPRVALVAPRVMSAPGRSGLAQYETGASPLDLGDQPARVQAGTRVSYVPAAAMVCRTAALRQVDGFDDELRVGEDVDLCWRLDQAGWRCRYEPASVVHHDPRRSWRGWFTQRVAYGRSAAPLAQRHPDALAPVRIGGWSLLTWVLVAVGRPVAAVGVGLGTALALIRKLDDLPPRTSFRFAALGNLRAGTALASAVRRVWWPILAVAAVRSKAARRTLVLSVLAGKTPIGIADDVAYSVGVWQGMWRERSVVPLLPRLSSWPGASSTPPAR